jgi:hypothetical protein
MSEILDFEIRKKGDCKGRYDVSVARRGEASPAATGGFDLKVSSLTEFAVAELEQDGGEP